jgi:hypothetical protein
MSVVALAAVALVAAGCSSVSESTSNPSTHYVATGSVSCGAVTGSLAFSPALSATGTAPQTTTIALKATGCSTSGSSASGVTGGTTTVTVHSPTSACSGVLTLRSLGLTIDWTPSAIRPSVVHFSEYSIVSSPSGSAGFAFPNPGGTATVVGSFTGSDRGAKSTASVFFSPSVAQVLAVCRSSGLATLQVVAGHVALK